jgi:multimeric flavodoxin WrbA
MAQRPPTIPDPSAPARDVRHVQPDPRLDREVFIARFRARFFDPAFEDESEGVAALADIAWQAYNESRKAPRTMKAGPEFADPDYDLSVEWRATRDAILDAQSRQRDPAAPRRILLVCASPRSEHTCPGESSKTWRLLQVAQTVLQERGAACDVIELNRLTSEYGRVIHPCKACVSTAMPLCHWPCSCYPNHALGQVPDWMGEIYVQWAAAHGVLILTPVHWNHVPSVLKLMMDRLVCADGGNSDPTRTQGKKAELAKQIELDGWDYPQHLAGRAFGLVVHGDTEGVRGVRHALADWLQGMGLVDAGYASQLDRYVGYYEPYAVSHRALDDDAALFEETRNVALALLERVEQLRHGQAEAGADLPRARRK